jgi:hypothetical protein
MTQILDIDEILATAALPEKVAYFTVAPALEAELDVLVAELDTLVDHLGRARAETPEDVRPVGDVVADIESVRGRLLESRRSVRMRGLSAEGWDEFMKRHRTAVDGGVATSPPVAGELISLCAVEPEMSAEQVAGLWKALGPSQMKVLVDTAFHLHLSSPVDMPRIDGLDRVRRNL